MATYDPYIKRAAGDFIAADDWNEIQRLGRQDLAEHDHTGGLKGPKLTGDAIAADATLTVKRVNADEIKLADRLLGKRLTDLEAVATAALPATGGTIEGSLTIAGDLTVKGTINGAVTSSGGGATFGVAQMSLGQSYSKASFSTMGLSVSVTLTETSIVTATANIGLTDAASASFAFVAQASTSRVAVPFVPSTKASETTTADTGTAALSRTILSSGDTQIDPTTYYKLLAAAAKLGDDGVGVGAKVSTALTKTVTPVSFTQVTALPAGTYNVALAMLGTASVGAASIFVVTQTADLSLFSAIR